MNRIGLIGALVGLRDLKRARGLLGRLAPRRLCGATQMVASGRMPLHDGSIGEITASTLMREAAVAKRFLLEAFRRFREDHPAQAVNLYFLAAAIATNVIFAANVHEIELPGKVVKEMNTVITEATRGIKRIVAGKAKRAVAMARYC